MADPSVEQVSLGHEGPLFRAPRRRKVFRRKGEEEDSRADTPGFTQPVIKRDAVIEAQTSPSPQSDLGSLTDHPENRISDALRLRKAARSRRGGIGFSNARTQTSSLERDAGALVLIAGTAAEEEAPSALDAIGRRFAPQAGQVTNVTNDKIMNTYIVSELARLKAGSAHPDAHSKHLHDGSLLLEDKVVPGGLLYRDPASVGKLQEIDLGPSASMRNIAMTDAATRRLEGRPPLATEQPGPPAKVRLGRDGKPRRKRWRRNSDDVKRDSIVEAIMKESRLDIYEAPDAVQETTGNDLAADDQLADEFRREFTEAIEARNKQRKPTAPPAGPSKGPQADNPLRGPKLGGSRSARAAMHAQEKEKEKAAKKR